MRLGIRRRLVLGAAAAATLMLLTALLVARVQLTTLLTAADERLALADVTPYVTDLRRGDGERPDPPSTGALVAVRAPDGERVIDTMPPDVRERLGTRPITSIRTASGEYVVARRQVTVRSGTWTVWAARDATVRATQAATVDLVLLGTGAVLIIAFAVASDLLVRGALRPVERLRSRAATLGSDELLPVPPGDDELARLAETLNGLVEGTRASAAHERRMIANAAHELRTPIANLRAAVDLARRDPTPVRLGELTGSIDRLGDLATNLLELSRLDEGAQPVPTRAADLEDAVLTALDGWRTRLAGSAIDIDHSIEILRGDVLAPLDGIAVTRIVDNLVGNAVTALAGTGAVVVSVRVDEAGLRLAVEDDGPGIPAELLPDAFDRFVRGAGGGSGLGLALVRALAESGSGRAELHPLERGLRVVVTVPVERPRR